MDLHPALRAAQQLRAALAGPGAEPPLEEALGILEGIQGLRNVLDACEVHALAHVSAIEEIAEEDGTLSQRHRGIGHRAEFAPELVAPRLGVSVHVAAARMEHALDLIERAPCLLEEMSAGRLDGFRARLVLDETHDAPVEVATAVAQALTDRATTVGGWTETAGPLRRRALAILGRIAPEVIAARAGNERARRGLTRRIESGSLDRWEGLYSVEESRIAWAAIDRLAKEKVARGEADTLHQARADAHMELLLGQVSTRILLHQTMPGGGPAPMDEGTGNAETVVATARGAAPGSGQDGAGSTDGPETVDLTGFGGSGPATVRREWLDARLADGTAVIGESVPCDPATGAVTTFTRTGEGEEQVEDQYRPSARLRRQVALRDGRCRFPNCTIAAIFCDVDHVTAWPLGATGLANLMLLCRRHHRLKQSGWRVRLQPDGTADWLDPLGHHHLTDPIDHTGATLGPLGPLGPLNDGWDGGLAAGAAAKGGTAATGGTSAMGGTAAMGGASAMGGTAATGGAALATTSPSVSPPRPVELDDGDWTRESPLTEHLVRTLAAHGHWDVRRGRLRPLPGARRGSTGPGRRRPPLVPTGNPRITIAWWDPAPF